MKLILVLLLLFMIQFSSALDSEKLYLMDINYKEGSLELFDVNVITGFPNINDNLELPYKLELLSPFDNILFTGYFEIPNILYATPPLNPGEKTGIFEITDVNFSISFPYNKQGNKAIITKDGKELLAIDVSEFSIYCGDRKCHEGEFYNNCPQDCVSGIADGYCDDILDERCDPDCNKDPDCKKTSWLYLLIIALIALIVIIALVTYKKRRK